MKEKFFNVQDWFPISFVDENIHLKNNKVIALFEVRPINFKLKSDVEQNAILEAYRRFLKQCDFDIQVIVTSYKVDVHNHIENVDKYTFENEKLSKMKESYIDLIEKICNSNRTLERKFFIVIKVDENFEQNKAKLLAELDACGNEVIRCGEEEIYVLLKNFFKRNGILKK